MILYRLQSVFVSAGSFDTRQHQQLQRTPTDSVRTPFAPTHAPLPPVTPPIHRCRSWLRAPCTCPLLTPPLGRTSDDLLFAQVTGLVAQGNCTARAQVELEARGVCPAPLPPGNLEDGSCWINVPTSILRPVLLASGGAGPSRTQPKDAHPLRDALALLCLRLGLTVPRPSPVPAL